MMKIAITIQQEGDAPYEIHIDREGHNTDFPYQVFLRRPGHPGLLTEFENPTVIADWVRDWVREYIEIQDNA